jgi:hypothetical protein
MFVSFLLIRTIVRPIRKTVQFAADAGINTANVSRMRRICRNTVVGGALTAVPFMCLMAIVGVGFLWFHEEVLNIIWLNPFIVGHNVVMVMTDVVS